MAPRLGLGARHQGPEGGPDLHVLGPATGRPGPVLHLGVEPAGAGQVALVGEDDVRVAGGEVDARRGRTRLEQDGTALRRCGDAPRPAEARRVPQGEDLVDGAFREFVPHAVRDGRAAEVRRFLRQDGRHDVPSGPATGDRVERGEPARQPVCRPVGRGAGRDESDVLRGTGQPGQEDHGLEVVGPGGLVEAGALAPGREQVGAEDRVDPAPLQLHGQELVEGVVELARGGALRVTPSGPVAAGAVQQNSQCEPPGERVRHCGLSPRRWVW